MQRRGKHVQAKRVRDGGEEEILAFTKGFEVTVLELDPDGDCREWSQGAMNKFTANFVLLVDERRRWSGNRKDLVVDIVRQSRVEAKCREARERIAPL